MDEIAFIPWGTEVEVQINPHTTWNGYVIGYVKELGDSFWVVVQHVSIGSICIYRPDQISEAPKP